MVCSHCERWLPLRALASSVPAISSLRESPHSQDLRTARSSLQYLHNRLSIHLNPCRSRQRYFVISLVRQVGTFMRSFVHSFSILELLRHVMTWSTLSFPLKAHRRLRTVPVHTVPSTLHYSCARSGREGAELANVLTNATHNGCLVCPLHRRIQVSINSRSVVATTGSDAMRGHVTGQVFFLSP